MRGKFVVNADDFGLSRGATLGVIEAHLKGIVTSASLSPCGLDYDFAVASAGERCPELGIGLHFTLSAGAPVSAPEDVPLLVDDDGRFRWEFLSLLKTLRLKKESPLLDQIGVELEAQILKLKQDGIAPDHLNSERHVHLIPGIFERVVEAAIRHDIPFVRGGRETGLSYVTPRNFANVVLSGGILKYVLLQTLSRLNGPSFEKVRVCDYFASYLFTGRLDLVLERIVASNHAGVTEIMVHPGVPEESRNIQLGNEGLGSYLTSEDRRREMEACIAARRSVEPTRLSRFRDLVVL